METFTCVEGIAAPLPLDNIDTDSIIPSRETQSVVRSGYAEKLFANWRYTPGTRIINSGFVLNREPFNHAVILVTGANFGCGSSREAAVWSLKQFGIRAVIAQSFGSIFFHNCIRNGLLPVVLHANEIAKIHDAVANSQGRATVSVDLVAMQVRTAGQPAVSFVLAARDREMLLCGADEIAVTLRSRDAIDAFRAKDQHTRPWLYARRRS